MPAKDSILGCFITGPEGYDCYIPYDLNGIDFDFSAHTLAEVAEVTRLLGQLEGQASQLMREGTCAPLFVWTESYYSQLLAGVRTDYLHSLAYLLRRRGEKEEHAEQIARGRSAFMAGWQGLKEAPLSTELMIRLHRLLLEDSSVSLRLKQSWLGGKDPQTAIFVPPPPYEVANSMAELERFIHRRDEVLPLLKIGLVYAQLETIRPFMNSNSRSARALLHLLFISQGLLTLPVLSLSRQFYLRRQSYYAAVDAYRRGDYDEWLVFFLIAANRAGQHSLGIMDEITRIRAEDLARLEQLHKTASHNGRRLLSHLFNLPLVDVTQAMQWLGVSRPAAQTIIDRLVKLEILRPLNDNKKYGKAYVYGRYFALFE